MSDLKDRLALVIPAFEGVPTPGGLAEVVGVTQQTVGNALDAQLIAAMEERGRIWLGSLDDQQLIAKLSGRGRLTYLPEYARGIVEARLKSMIFTAIENINDVPNPTNIATVLGIEPPSVTARIDHDIEMAMEARGRAYLASLDDRTLVSFKSTQGWGVRFPPYAKEIVKERLQQFILTTTASFDGVPTLKGLGNKVGMEPKSVVANGGEGLHAAMEARGREWLASLTDPELITKVSTTCWMPSLPDYVMPIITDRIKGIIRTTIQEVAGIPSLTSIAEKMVDLYGVGLSHKTIGSYLDQDLEQEMETRGRTYLNGLDEETVIAEISTNRILSKAPYAREIIEGRLKAILLIEIERYDGIPNPTILGGLIGLSSAAIARRFDSDAELQLALTQKEDSYIASLDWDGLLAKISQAGWVPGLSDHAKSRIDERIRQRTLEVIGTYDGVPTIYGLARLMQLTNTTLEPRVDTSVEAAMEARGREWLTTVEDRELLRRNSNGLGTSLPAYAGPILEQRLKQIYLRTIQSFECAPTLESIAERLEVAGDTVRARINGDLDLWLAYHAKRGLSPDQAIELALERDETSPAATIALAQRLRNLAAFREMAGLLKCFGDALVGRVLEVTLYPKPLEAASADLGVTIEVVHAPMQSFRQGMKPELPAAEAAVVQSIHRLAAEGLTALFEEVHKAVPQGKTVLLTHSVDYAPTDGFVEALSAAGFEVKETGTLVIEAPSRLQLRALGVPDEDIPKVQRKLSGESVVFVLTTDKKSNIPAQIPALEKIERETETGDRTHPQGNGINSPDGVAKHLDVRFLDDCRLSSAPSDPYLVEVEHLDQLVGLIGYDMNLKRPRKPESVPDVRIPELPAREFDPELRAIARKMAQNAEMRTGLGIRPNDITRVSLSKCRTFMK